MNTQTLDRNEILREIRECEARLEELRAILPSPIKKFYVYRCKPERSVMVYAANEEQAAERLRERMHASYPEGNWQIVSKKVDVYADPASAANQSRGPLLNCLTDSQAREFAQDYRENQRGREIEQLKDRPMSQVERDIDYWEKQQLRKNS